MKFTDFPQAVELDNPMNTRHFGGYTAVDGRIVEKKKLSRSGSTEGFSERDINFLLDEYNLKYLIDLRSESEIAGSPSLTDLPGVQYINLPLADVTGQIVMNRISAPAQYLIDLYNRAGGTPESAFQWMITTYTDIVTVEGYIENTRKIFDILLENEDGCVFYHCTGGKDRTGVLSMLILTALGVDSAIIMRDYLYTNDFLDTGDVLDEILEATGDPDVVEGVQYFINAVSRFLETVISLLEENYGSVKNYLSKALGLTPWKIERLRSIYTYSDEYVKK